MARFAWLLAAAAVVAPIGALAGDEADGEPVDRLFSVKIDKPGGMAFDGRLLWVADRVGLLLHGLDPHTGEERKVLPAPGPWPTGVAFDGRLLWVADRQRGRLFGVDTEKGLVARELESPPGPLGLAFDGRHLWVADGKSLHQVTTEDGTTIVTWPAPSWGGQGRAGEQLGLAFAEGYLWVSDRTRDMLYKVEPSTGEVFDLLPSPGPFPAGMAEVDGKLLVADVDGRRVDAVAINALPAVVRRGARDEKVVLRRSLANRGPDALAEANVWVAVPQSLPSQALAGEPVFEPAPDEIRTDRWGQKVARFKARNLRPGESLTVTMTVEATLFATRWHIDPARVGALKNIPKAVRDAYLVDETKFAIRHPSIEKAVKEALGDEKRPYSMIRRIATYIRKKMEYEMVGGWNIAPTVIDRGTGSCSEYTFVFISMCRAVGIPARYAGAIVVRGDDASTDEAFHRWAEVYLPGYGWVPIDVQGGDKPEPEKQGEAFGGLDNRFLITTVGGGASDLMKWDYNSYAEWTCKGRCLVEDLNLGDWYPAADKQSRP
jgi:sugar lactone lactonase YvrE